MKKTDLYYTFDVNKTNRPNGILSDISISSIENIPTRTKYSNITVHKGMRVSDGAYIITIFDNCLILGHTRIVCLTNNDATTLEMLS